MSIPVVEGLNAGCGVGVAAEVPDVRSLPPVVGTRRLMAVGLWGHGCC